MAMCRGCDAVVAAEKILVRYYGEGKKFVVTDRFLVGCGPPCDEMRERLERDKGGEK